MFLQDPNKNFSFEFDENGANEVSEQIMDSYNSGYINQDFSQNSTEVYETNEE